MVKTTDTKREDTTENKVTLSKNDKSMLIVFATIPAASFVAMPFTSVWLPIVINGALLTIVGSIALTHYVKGSSFR